MKAFSKAAIVLGILVLPFSLPVGYAVGQAARSVSGKIQTTITFVNNSNETRKVHWMDSNSKRKLCQVLSPGQSFQQQTYLTHAWLITDERDNKLSIHYPDSIPRIIHLQ